MASIVGCRCSRGSATVYCFVGFLDRYSPSIVRGFFLRGRSASLSRSVPWSQRVLPESTTKDIPSFRSRRSRSWLLLLLRSEQRGKDLRNPVRYEAPEHTTKGRWKKERYEAVRPSFPIEGIPIAFRSFGSAFLLPRVDDTFGIVRASFGWRSS